MIRLLKYFIPLVAVVQSFAQQSQPLPNVLFIIVDDLRPELNLYGKDFIKSPNIDALAAQGITFNRAYCNVPVCGASRASMLTGVRPTKSRFLRYYSSINEAGPNIKHMVDYFNERDYNKIIKNYKNIKRNFGNI